MAVITVSREYGSAGDQIAAHICQRLNYAYFDKKMMLETAAEVGLSAQDVIDFSEEQYRVRGFVSRLLRGRPHEADLGALPLEEVESSRFASTSRLLNEEQFVDLMRYIVLSAYDSGNIVIVGRGGQAILADKPGVIHLRVVASMDDRIEALRARGMTGVSTIKHALHEHDQATAQYLKRFYNIDWADPIHYHLVINASRVTPQQAGEIVASMVAQMENAPTA